MRSIWLAVVAREDVNYLEVEMGEDYIPQVSKFRHLR